MSIRSVVLGLFLLGPVIVATGGCQSTPAEPAETKPTPQPTRPVTLPRIPGLTTNQAAARETLESAESLLREGDWVGAQAQFSVLDRGALAGTDLPRYTLLAAELAIRSGRLDEARRMLATLDASHLPDPVDAALAEAWLTAASGEPGRAADSLMRSRVPPAAEPRVNDTIWELVTQTPAFEAMARAETGTDTERGWWALRRELLVSGSLADQNRRVAAWQAAWPAHPAAKRLPAPLRSTGRHYVAPRHVALLLPVSGPLARAGRAVRDGFMAAYLERPVAERFAVAVYDTNAAPLAAVYQRAVADGADVMVGPLRREEVAAINDLGPRVPVLALNYLAGSDPAPNLAQLGLAIEDDAATLAAWLHDEGFDRIMVLHGSDEWTIRARQALADQGIAPADTQLLPDLRTVTESVGTAMHIAASEARHAELQGLLDEPLQFRARSRSDIDAIVALVNAVEVTALVPALRYHYADRIPAFATAQTLQGGNQATLRAMNGFNVVELPWAIPGDRGHELIAGAFPLTGNPFASMYGLGADALRLVDRIHPDNRSAFTQILGNTGVLTLAPDGRLRRELARMRIERSQLSLAAPATVR